MGISQQIEAVYQRALLLRERATALPIQPALLDDALRELYLVLEELQATDLELQQQNQSLLEAQQQLDLERQRYRTLFELAPDGYLVTDRQGKIFHANQAAATLLAVPQANLVDKPLIVFVDPADRPQFLARLAQPDDGDQDWEVLITRRHEASVAVAITTARVKGDRGQGVALLWSLRDISQRKQIQQNLQAELGQAQAHLDRSQRLDSLGTLASGLAHDLGNDLSPLVTATDLLRLPKYGLAESAYPVVEMMKSSALRSLDLVRQLLLFAQGGTGERQPLSLGLTLGEVVAMIRSTVPSSITVQWPGDDDGVWVEAEPTPIHQVFMNLCLNACDAMADGGTLAIALETRQIDSGDPQLPATAPPGRYAVATIADNGSGIDPAIVDRIFDPFFTTKSAGQGTGLGLATTFRIVQNHGGFIQVDSQVGVGSRFQVFLPAIASPPGALPGAE